MRAGRVHHVAVVVPRIEDALPFYVSTLGLAAGEPHELPEQRVRAVFVGDGSTRLELIEPTDPASGVARFLAAQGRSALHHVCYEVTDIDAALAELRADGHELVDERPREGLVGRVAFLHPRSAGGVLVELVEVVGGPRGPDDGRR